MQTLLKVFTMHALKKMMHGQGHSLSISELHLMAVCEAGFRQVLTTEVLRRS